ncbi:hypothetical protein COT44_02300 [Candidatus Shapirobacteria bacterium CG08_land_8_20_14_0_20_39_18]|uniref:Uncharacterized protein n=1 Tax=Candidatus Shapirobacteria bacterium CG08_land_8_20_14_0_20_39_18 TaxID=1974883 RepID=A0A2M6XD49_9BACT|nr:MAG: hypothetical protein COT44_02300 [Candidatus Shapirobacteria bacterium CG08_land_8_20_14_0_20_39_18]PIY66141.1 MAG: hypothetical protein COY91_01570 [Candidatus Shapirobacteria bacterium CG_4_10_14_0_8_um_filter_39_15]PJE68844.1 MAG: hypothetical protein COU94_00045 [Candidatus Shapirobacteria bacterium CG10_big_fil_rev_8_21_14_0_10_38_8]
MLTQRDLNEIENLLDQKLDEKLETKLNEKLSFLPTKDDFYSKMDQVMGELQTIREEQSMGSHRISDHEDRITVIEQKTGIVTT